MSAAVRFRHATEEDVPALQWMIQLLAEYEKEPHAMKIGKKELLRDGFGEEPCFKVLLVELSSPPADTGNINPAVPAHTGSPLPSDSMEKNERLVGYAFYFFSYSTWEGRALHMEDLFIRAEYRNQGHGTALMKEVAKIARGKDCCRMVWQVLDWNTKARDLYERIGGEWMKEWLTIRMCRPQIQEFTSSP